MKTVQVHLIIWTTLVFTKSSKKFSLVNNFDKENIILAKKHTVNFKPSAGIKRRAKTVQ